MPTCKRNTSANTITNSGKFNSLTILQDKGFTDLDSNLQQSVKVLLQKLIGIHEKMEQTLQVHQTVLDRSQQELLSLARKAEAEVAKQAVEKSRKLDNHVNESLLCSLRFPTMRNRHEEISEAHQMTFAWIFQPPQQDCRPWTDFPKWLQEDSPLYWVNGKAGSGKSTLMRYIYDNAQTKHHLETWGGAAEVVMAGFFFWNSGSIEQRSKAGVFRCLLYEILRKRPDLIRSVFESSWAEYRSLIQAENIKNDGRPIKTFEWEWTFPILQHALTRLTTLANSRFKLCLFIDGLDECEGDQEDIADYFVAISKLQNIKVCVSSRPWLLFEDTFKQCSGLRLQDLTRPDMRAFVHDKLVANERMQQLLISNPASASKFAKIIQTKANGVFLWVKLVTLSLLKGLRNKDSIADLQKRLESLPSDLNALYCVMLSRIDEIYVTQASRIFQIYDQASDLDLRMSVLELEIAVSAKLEDGIKPEREVMSTDEVNTRSAQMTAHLNSRCEGLLEVHEHADRHWSSVDDMNDPIDWATARRTRSPNIDDEEATRVNAELHRTKDNLKVSYLHRTVKDFLKSEFVRAKLRREAVVEFDPNLSLLIAYVVYMKSCIFSFQYDPYGVRWVPEQLWQAMEYTLKCARNTKDHSSRDLLLNQVYYLGQQWWQHKSFSINPQLLKTNPYCEASDWCEHFLCVSVSSGLTSFVDKTLQKGKEDNSSTNLLTGPHGVPLLCYSLSLLPRFSRIQKCDAQLCIPSMVSTLLRHGTDPNQRIAHSDFATVWELLLKTAHSENAVSRGDVLALRDQTQIFTMMLEHGADPLATCTEHDVSGENLDMEDSRWGAHTVADVIDDIFAKCLPDESVSLHELLKKKISERTERNIKEKELVRDSETPRKRSRNNSASEDDLDGRVVSKSLDDAAGFGSQSSTFVNSSSKRVKIE